MVEPQKTHASDLTNLSQRGKLVSMLLLLEAIQAKTLTPEACAEWLRDTMGLVVDTIGEKGIGLVPLKGSWSPMRAEKFQAIAEAARQTIVKTMRGLLQKPQNDGFVTKAIYQGRVQRSERDKGKWTPVVGAGDALSDVLLALFVADILAYRDSYDARLSVCDECGRITFVERRGVRFGCSEHPV